MSVSIVQCPLPSLKEKADRFVTSIDIHILNRRSPNGIDSNTGVWCGAEFVLLHLNWTGFHIQTRHPCWTNQRTVSHPSCTNRIIFAWITCMFNVIEYAEYVIVSVVNVYHLGLISLPAAPVCRSDAKYRQRSLLDDNLSVMELENTQREHAIFEK